MGTGDQTRSDPTVLGGLLVGDMQPFIQSGNEAEVVEDEPHIEDEGDGAETD